MINTLAFTSSHIYLRGWTRGCPLLCLLCFDFFGGNFKSSLGEAMCIRVYHNFVALVRQTFCSRSLLYYSQIAHTNPDFQYCNIAVLHFNIAILFLDFCNIALLFKNVVLQYCNIAKSQEVLKCNTLENDTVFCYFQMKN